MKRTITLLALALSLSMAVSCKDDKAKAETENTATDPEAEKSAIFATADKFHTAFREKKAEDIKNLTTETGVYMGTDPEEVYNQQSFRDYLMKKLNNPAIGTIEYKIDRREIVFEDNSKSAVVIDQFTPIAFTQNIPWRMVSHLVKKDGSWKFDFISLSMVPKNGVVPAINMAAYQGE
jgi:hypothetical protein